MMAKFANNAKEAWEIANKVFGFDYEKDEAASKRAGYPIYRATAEGKYHYWISDLCDRLELNMDGETVNIWISEGPKYTAAEVKEIITSAMNEIGEIRKFRDRIGSLENTQAGRDVKDVLVAREIVLYEKLAEFGV